MSGNKRGRGTARTRPVTSGRRPFLPVVTAVLLTPEEFPGELGGSYQAACAALGVDPISAGYGLVLVQDREGARWTQITTDVTGIASAQAIWNSGLECAYRPPPGSVVAKRPGWPVECALGLARLPEPHDPPTTAPGELLRPPGGRGWTPARRRQLADAIAGELADMMGRTWEEHAEAHRWDAYNLGDTDPGPPPPRLIDMRQPPAGPHPSIDRALRAAWSLAAAAKPPPGSVRSRRATRSARLLRAIGDGWTLIGRTDGPVILLLDDAPGVPLDIGDLPQTAGLLDALTVAANRCPS
jgi:hypothetical protein